MYIKSLCTNVFTEKFTKFISRVSLRFQKTVIARVFAKYEKYRLHEIRMD